MRFSSNSDEVFFELVIFGIVLSCFLLLKTITIGCVGFYCLIQWRKKFGSDWELFLSTCFDKNRWFFWFQILRQNYLLFLGFYWLFGVVLFGLVQDRPCSRMLSSCFRSNLVSGPTLGLLFPCVGWICWMQFVVIFYNIWVISVDKFFSYQQTFLSI